MPLALHTSAPDFTLPSSAGRDVSLSKDLAGKPVVLFFYPKNFTRTCTAEVCGFRDIYDELEGMGVALFGISRDGLDSHSEFKNRYDLPFELLTDKSGKVCKAYDALVPILGLPSRVTYLLNAEHQIEVALSNFLSADAHTEAVLKHLRANANV